jgi:hypothetical protein
LSKPPTCEQLAKSGSEHGEQVAVMHWSNMQLKRWPELEWLHAIPNGGMRAAKDEKNKDGVSMAAIRGGQLKAEGVKEGVCDLMLPVARRGYHGLYIEMKKVFNLKKESLHYASEPQKKFIAFVQGQGYCAGVAQGWQQAVAVLEWYMGEPNEP